MNTFGRRWRGHPIDCSTLARTVHRVAVDTFDQVKVLLAWENELSKVSFSQVEEHFPGEGYRLLADRADLGVCRRRWPARGLSAIIAARCG